MCVSCAVCARVCPLQPRLQLSRYLSQTLLSNHAQYIAKRSRKVEAPDAGPTRRRLARRARLSARDLFARAIFSRARAIAPVALGAAPSADGTGARASVSVCGRVSVYVCVSE